MFKKTAIVAGISLALSATAQADYQWQVDAAASRTNIDVGFDDGDADNFGIAGSYFLESVDTSKGPLSEAAFVDQASSVSLSYIYTDLDDIIEDVDGDEYGLEGRYVTDNAGWIIEGSYSRQTPDFSDIDTYSVGFGKYLTDNTTLTVSYVKTDIDEGGDTDGYVASVEHLWTLSSGAIKLEGNAGFVNVDDGDDIDVYNVAATYYINNNLGLGASYGKFDGGGAETDEWSLFAEWFINEQFAVSAAYAESELDDTDIEIDAFAIGGTFRF